ncbi:3-oxoacyl-ACP synthase [Actinophytocola xinjiangensis]|uniref:3-oxoacyl-ACP synthase n=1 Tax=Actinophytocola xinjiangensis TaxID=485602 RepID=A0A7Z0WE64_9PSEU|nr:3-oxoacyl-ACP synthase [Actinophytocola xinjiangensis]
MSVRTRPGPGEPVASLVEVAAYVPDTSVTVEEAAVPLGLSPQEQRRYRRFLGLDRVRWDPAAHQVDLLCAAAGALESLRGNEHRVRFVLHARTIEPTGPYSVNPLHQAVGKLGLGHATAFGVSQHACASGLLAVDLAARLLAAQGDPSALALVLTGEKTYRHVARFMLAATIMGESSAACLVGLDGPRDRLVAYASRTDGRFHELTAVSGEVATAFGEQYPAGLAAIITEAVDAAGLTLDDLALILPHNVNRVSWTRLCNQLGLPFDRVWLDNIPRTGHCFCADTFVNHTDATAAGRLRPGDHYLMVSVGLGATFSAMVLQH